MSKRKSKEIEINPTLLGKATYDFIIDELRPPKLSRCEFMLLLIIARQTVGWKDPDYPDCTKERDWLSMKQLKERTGYGRTSLSKAQEKLSVAGYIDITIADKHFLEALPWQVGLNTPKLRQLYGVKYKDHSKFHYSLTSGLMKEIIRQVENYLSEN